MKQVAINKQTKATLDDKERGLGRMDRSNNYYLIDRNKTGG